MCGGAFGKVQNFRHNVETGFGIIPKNSPTGKRVEMEAGMEDSMAGGTQHGSDASIKAANAKAAAEAQAKETAAIDNAKKSSDSVAAKQKEIDDYNAAQLAQLTEEQKMKQQKSLLAQASTVSDQPKTKATSTTKVTLLGG